MSSEGDTVENLEKLIKTLCEYPSETSWLEFKHNNFNPEMIGKDISALANGATLSDKEYAYFIWGVDDQTKEIIGTNTSLSNLKKGGEELESWLRKMLSKNADFNYHTLEVDGLPLSIMVIKSAQVNPVSFQNMEYIRVGSYTKKLMDHPAIQTRLWNKLQKKNFEEQAILEDLELSSALRMLDYGVYFDLIGTPQPENWEGISHFLIQDGILIPQDNGLFSITNLGAILLGKKLSDFQRISRKALRVIQYQGHNRLRMLKEFTSDKGYVVDFRGIVDYIEALTPTREAINGALREKETAFPIIAIRELLANALIHQDFSVSGTGPTVEIFENRLEITNSGVPLVDIKRIIDNPPKSRNEKLASLMRRMKICEELGTGWDRIVLSCEFLQIPTPKIELFEESTKVTMFSEVPFANIPLEDKLWACYMHACVMYVQGDRLTNSSLRARFGVPPSSTASISRLIKEAIKNNLIKPLDPTLSNKHMKYVPIWA